MTDPAQQPDENTGRPGPASGALHYKYREREETKEAGENGRLVVDVESVRMWGTTVCINIVRYPPTGTLGHRRAYALTDDELERHFELITPCKFRVVAFGQAYKRPTKLQANIDAGESV